MRTRASNSGWVSAHGRRRKVEFARQVAGRARAPAEQIHHASAVRICEGRERVVDLGGGPLRGVAAHTPSVAPVPASAPNGANPVDMVNPVAASISARVGCEIGWAKFHTCPSGSSAR